MERKKETLNFGTAKSSFFVEKLPWVLVKNLDPLGLGVEGGGGRMRDIAIFRNFLDTSSYVRVSFQNLLSILSPGVSFTKVLEERWNLSREVLLTRVGETERDTS